MGALSNIVSRMIGVHTNSVTNPWLQRFKKELKLAQDLCNPLMLGLTEYATKVKMYLRFKYQKGLPEEDSD